MATTADFPAVSDGGAESKPFVVIGCGPAGLTAGYLLS